jgi:hypothetical protein
MNNVLPTFDTKAATARGIRKGLAEIALRQAVAEGFDPAWQTGTCPVCSGPMVTNSRKIGGVYRNVSECWMLLGSETRHDERHDAKLFPVEEAKCERCQVRAADPCFSTPGNPRWGKCEP